MCHHFLMNTSYNTCIRAFICTVCALCAVFSALCGTTGSGDDVGVRRDRLLQYLNSLSGRHGKKILSGQQCEAWPRIAKTRLGDLERIYAKTGKWPAIGGFEYCEMKGSTTEPALFKPPRWREVNPFIKEWNEKGGLVTISAHLPNPWTGSSAWDTSERKRLSELCLPDSASRRAYWRMVEGLADGLEDLQRIGIVVLWRPFHELEGSWFWWGGEGREGSRATVLKRLWREMHKYMTEKRRLDNLIWVFNGKLCHYPGDDVVDLNSADIYGNNVGESISKLVPALASNDKKPFALAEFGPSWKKGQIERYDFSDFANEVLAAAPNCAYFLCWTGPWSLWHNDNTDKLMSDPRIVTLDDLKFELGLAARQGNLTEWR
jgi:mannan endo-1,4-beta-mannosidase